MVSYGYRGKKPATSEILSLRTYQALLFKVFWEGPGGMLLVTY